MVSSSVTMASKTNTPTAEPEHHYKIKEKTEKLIRPHQADTEMVLSRDVHTDAGQLLFRKGNTINTEMIEKAKRFDIRRFYVRDYQTRWVDKESLDDLGNTVTVVEKKEIPPEEQSVEKPPAGDGETFQELFELINQTNSPEKLRGLIDTLVDEAEREPPKFDLPEDQVRDIRNHTDNMEEHVKHVLGRLGSVANKQDRAQILKQMFDADQQRGELDLPKHVPGDVKEAVTKAKEQENKTRTGLQDIIHNHTKVTEALDRDVLPDKDVEIDQAEIENEDGSVDTNALLNLLIQIASDSNGDSQDSDELLEVINNIGMESLRKQSQEEDVQSSTMEDLDSDELDSIRSALNTGSTNNSAQAMDHLMSALKQLEVGQWHGAIDQFDQCVEETPSVESSPVKNLVKRSHLEQNKRPQLEKQLGDVSSELDPKSVIDQLLAPEQNETIVQLREQGVPQPLLDDLLQYQETVKSLAINTCQALSNQLPDILANVEQETHDKIIRNFNEMVERLKDNWLDISGKWELYERESPEHGTVDKQSEQLKDALKRDDINDLKQHTELPEEVVDQYQALYLRPNDVNKWQKKLIDSTKQLMDQLVLTMTVPESMIDRQYNQIKELYHSEQKPFSLICSPPEPDHYHLVHAYNSCLISTMVGLERDLPENALKTLIPASLLADIGLTIIPPSLYLKQDDLSKRADNEISKHPIYSREIVGRIFGKEHSVTQLVAQHHEQINGGGYPNGLKKEKLHPLTPILSACDVFTARVENRIYRKSQMPDQVLKEMMDQPDRYHQSVVESIVQCIGYYPNGTLVKLNNGQIAFVRKQNETDPLNPEVILLTDTKRNKLDNPKKQSLTESDGLEAELVVKT